MKLLKVKSRVLLFLVAVVGLGSLTWVETSGWPNLEAVSLDGSDVVNWSARFPLSKNKPLLKQNLDSVATQLLSKKRIGKVDISYALPNRLSIETNRFEPIALMLEQTTGEFRGIDREGRVLPLESTTIRWDVPILTSVAARGLFVECDDVRVSVVMPQLAKLSEEASGFFALISEIDFGPADYLYVTVSGMPYRLRVESASIHEQITSFIHFIERYSPETDNVENFDLRYPGIIVSEESTG